MGAGMGAGATSSGSNGRRAAAPASGGRGRHPAVRRGEPPAARRRRLLRPPIRPRQDRRADPALTSRPERRLAARSVPLAQRHRSSEGPAEHVSAVGIVGEISRRRPKGLTCVMHQHTERPAPCRPRTWPGARFDWRPYRATGTSRGSPVNAHSTCQPSPAGLTRICGRPNLRLQRPSAPGRLNLRRPKTIPAVRLTQSRSLTCKLSQISVHLRDLGVMSPAYADNTCRISRRCSRLHVHTDTRFRTPIATIAFKVCGGARLNLARRLRHVRDPRHPVAGGRPRPWRPRPGLAQGPGDRHDWACMGGVSLRHSYIREHRL